MENYDRDSASMPDADLPEYPVETHSSEAHVLALYADVQAKIALRHPQPHIDAALNEAIKQEEAQHVAAYRQWELAVVVAQAKRDKAWAHNAQLDPSSANFHPVPDLPVQPQIDMALRRACYKSEYVEVDLALATQTQPARKEYDDELRIVRFYPATQAQSDDDRAQVKRKRFKIAREQKLAELTVRVDGLEFDADEQSQQRMARALVVMAQTDKTAWVLANNEVVQVSKAQLLRACKKAGEQQTALWLPE